MWQDSAVNGTEVVEMKMDLSTGDLNVDRKGSAGPVGKLMLLKANHSLHAPRTQV